MSAQFKFTHLLETVWSHCYIWSDLKRTASQEFIALAQRKSRVGDGYKGTQLLVQGVPLRFWAVTPMCHVTFTSVQVLHTVAETAFARTLSLFGSDVWRVGLHQPTSGPEGWPCPGPISGARHLSRYVTSHSGQLSLANPS